MNLDRIIRPKVSSSTVEFWADWLKHLQAAGLRGSVDRNSACPLRGSMPEFAKRLTGNGCQAFCSSGQALTPLWKWRKETRSSNSCDERYFVGTNVLYDEEFISLVAANAYFIEIIGMKNSSLSYFPSNFNSINFICYPLRHIRLNPYYYYYYFADYVRV